MSALDAKSRQEEPAVVVDRARAGVVGRELHDLFVGEIDSVDGHADAGKHIGRHRGIERLSASIGSLLGVIFGVQILPRVNPHALKAVRLAAAPTEPLAAMDISFRLIVSLQMIIARHGVG